MEPLPPKTITGLLAALKEGGFGEEALEILSKRLREASDRPKDLDAVGDLFGSTHEQRQLAMSTSGTSWKRLPLNSWLDGISLDYLCSLFTFHDDSAQLETNPNPCFFFSLSLSLSLITPNFLQIL